MKTISAHRQELTAVLGYEPTAEFTKKLLASLDVQWREEPTWSLPLRLRPEDPYDGLQLYPDEASDYQIVDADNSLLVDGGILLTADEVPVMQIILSAANAELARQSPAKRPLYFTQGSPE